MSTLNWRRAAWVAGALALACAGPAYGTAGGPSGAPSPAAGLSYLGPGTADGLGDGTGREAGQAPAFLRLPAQPAVRATSTHGAAASPFMLGWYTADNVSYAGAAVSALPVKPQVVNYYSMWGQPFMTPFARAAWADGVTTFVEIEPWHCGTCAEGKTPLMTSIAAGEYDRYLSEFGQAIKAFGHPVMITFGHEMNGPWYPWGDGGAERATPAQWVAAWDHVVTVVAGQAPGLTSWVWAPSVEPGTRSAVPFWPGDQYVDSVGIDGYLRTDAETYQSVFGATVSRFRRMTTRPIWIAETGLYINATTGSRLAAYVTAVRAAGLAGLLYFDRHPYVLRGSDQLPLVRVLRALPAPSA